MSDQATEPSATDATDQQQQASETKPTETVDFWKQKAREQERRAKENAAAATRLRELEDAQKSDAEKQADRVRQLEAERDNARRDVLRFKVASQYGITGEDADLFLTASDEETLTKQAERLAGRAEAQAKRGNHVPREGTTSSHVDTDEREAVRTLFG